MPKSWLKETLKERLSEIAKKRPTPFSFAVLEDCDPLYIVIENPCFIAYFSVVPEDKDLIRWTLLAQERMMEWLTKYRNPHIDKNLVLVCESNRKESVVEKIRHDIYFCRKFVIQTQTPEVLDNALIHSLFYISYYF